MFAARYAVFLTPNPTESGMYLVKRIIGVPGDRIRLHNGVVYLNGVRQAEPYVVRNGSYDTYRDEFPSAISYGIGQLAPGWFSTLEQSIHDGELVVPPDHYFAMGITATIAWTAGTGVLFRKAT